MRKIQIPFGKNIDFLSRKCYINDVYCFHAAVNIILPKRQFQNSSKLSKRPLLRSAKGSVFPPSHKATAGQAAVTLQVAASNYPLQFFANGSFAIF